MIKLKRDFLLGLFGIAIFQYSNAQKISTKAYSAINQTALKNEVSFLASDDFRGRESGTIDELKAAAWLAQQLQNIGATPSGENQTFFQYFDLYRNRIAPQSSIKIDQNNLQLWQNVYVGLTAPANISAPIILVEKNVDATINSIDVKDKIVALIPDNAGIDLNISLPEKRYMGYVKNKYYKSLIQRGALGVIFIANDQLANDAWYHTKTYAERGTYDVVNGPFANEPKAQAPILWMRSSLLNDLRKNPTIDIHIAIESFTVPSVNVLGKIEGTDAKLKNEFVIVSGHSDHVGIEEPYGKDSIYNGADDNASACAAVLEIAKAYKLQAAKRSILFVIFGAEERSMKGSRYYVEHPIIPKNQVAAILNADMIGNNTIDSAALLGSRYKNKNSDQLVAWANEANIEGPRFKLDTTWDKPDHPEFFYFRSDHAPFAQHGYPAIFFTTMLHPIYHTPMDEANTLNYPKLLKMTQWMYRTSWKVANAVDKPELNKDFKYGR